MPPAARSIATVLVLLPLVLTACESSPTAPEPTRQYHEGEQVQLNVQFGDGLLCSTTARDLRTGRVVAVTERAIVVADLGNPAGGFTDEQYRSLAATFDGQIWPTLTQTFGAPNDIDSNNRVVLFFTSAVNELAPPGQQWFVGGVFAARDLFPVRSTQRLGGCGGSNFAELIYMPVPDPAGEVNGNVRSTSSELVVAPGLMAHELQHLINASRRLYAGSVTPADWNEETWLNEGLSHVAEELMAYATSGLGPRQNLGIDEFVASQPLQNAFSRYLQPNFQWLAYYLEHPDTTSLYGDDSRAARGAAWQFLRYAADRRGGSEQAFWRGLVEPGATGLANLQRALGAEPLDWVHDWLVSVYTDDHAPGVAARFTQPSWDYRGLYPNLRTADGSSFGRYPLQTRTLVDGAQTSLTLAAGTAAYLRFGVAADGRAEIRSASNVAGCRESGPSLTVALGQVVMLAGLEAGVVCMEGGPEGAEFAYVPFNAVEAGTLSLTVHATGIIGLPDVAGATGRSLAMTSAVASGNILAASPGRASWEILFREQERRELSGLVPGTADVGPRLSPMSAGASIAPRVALVRTR